MPEILVEKSFFEAANRLSVADRAKALDFLGKLHRDPGHVGLNLERIQVARDPGMRSARVTRQVRAVVHQVKDRYSLLWVDQHDAAYDWASDRRLETHPTTNELQLFRVVETERTIPSTEIASKTVDSVPERIFREADHPDDYLLSLGVPATWLPTMRQLQSEDELYGIIDKIPEEVAERLLALAGGELVTPPPVPSAGADAPIVNRQRFWVAEDGAGILAELDGSMASWMHYLHPSQRELVDRDFHGPVKVTGAAGTGKTVVAMHRARAQARMGKRVLFTTYVKTLKTNIERNLTTLCSPDEYGRIEVSTVDSQALRICKMKDPGIRPVSEEKERELLQRSAQRHAPAFDIEFIEAEWRAVVEAADIVDWAAYRSVSRAGRGRPLGVRDRQSLWKVFEDLRGELADLGQETFAGLSRRACELLISGEIKSEFDAVMVDEIQDLSAAQLRLVAALAADNLSKGGLFLFGDSGQRIYPGGFSLSRLGIETRGRSHILRVNYRTTEQIRRIADLLRGDAVDDMADGGTERTRSRSLLRGPSPSFHGFSSPEAEAAEVVAQIGRVHEEGVALDEIAVFARTAKALSPIRRRLKEKSIHCTNLANDGVPPEGEVRLGSMHRAKGLEFRVVFVVGCNREFLPLRSLLQRQQDPADQDATRELEKNLLYVSLTRARDEAHVSWSGEMSEFLDELVAGVKD